jgi:hypothetical protein
LPAQPNRTFPATIWHATGTKRTRSSMRTHQGRKRRHGVDGDNAWLQKGQWSSCTWWRRTVSGINQENERRGPQWVRSYDVKLGIKRTMTARRQIRRIEPGGSALRFWVLGMELVAARVKGWDGGLEGGWIVLSKT